MGSVCLYAGRGVVRRPRVTVMSPGALAYLKLGGVLRSVVPVTAVHMFRSFNRLASSAPSVCTRCFVSTRVCFRRASFFLLHGPGAVMLTKNSGRPRLSNIPGLGVCRSRNSLVGSVRRLHRCKRRTEGRTTSGTVRVRGARRRLSIQRVRMLVLVAGKLVGGRVTSGLGVDLAAIVSRHGGVARGLNVGSISNLAICTIVGNCVRTSEVWGPRLLKLRACRICHCFTTKVVLRRKLCEIRCVGFPPNEGL